MTSTIEQRMFFEALCTTLYFKRGQHQPALTPWRLAFLEQWAEERATGLQHKRFTEDHGFPYSRSAVAELMDEVATVAIELRGGRLQIVDTVLRDEMILEVDAGELAECLRATGAPVFADKIAAGWRPMTAETDTLDERVQALEFAVKLMQVVAQSQGNTLRALVSEREAEDVAPAPSEAIGSGAGAGGFDWPVDA